MNHDLSMASRLKQVSHILLAATVAGLVYLGINISIFRHMSEANGVVAEKLVPNADHWPLAQELMAGRSLTQFSYPPGFSLYIISAVKAAEHWGGTYYAWRLLQDCLSTAITGAILMILIRRFTWSVWPAWGAICVLLYNVTYSAGTSADLAMAPFMPWFFGSLLLLVQAIDGRLVHSEMRAFSAGSLLAISGFIRPDILMFLPFMGIVFWLCWRLFWSRRGGDNVHFKPSVMRQAFGSALLGFSLILLPWAVYASVRSGSLVIYSTGFVHGHIDGMLRFSGNPASETFLRLWPQFDRYQIRQIHPGVDTTSLSPGKESIREAARAHLLTIRDYPADWLRLWLQKFWRPWYGSDSGKWNLVLSIQSLVLLPFVIVGLYFWLRGRGLDLGCVLAVGVVSYFWLVTVSVASINRYMPPAYPFLGMFIGFVAETRWRRTSLTREPQPSRGARLATRL